MAYDNVLKAISQNQSQPPVHEESDKMSRPLSALEQSRNYETFSMLMKEGVYLPDLLKRLDDLEGKVRNLESQPKHDANAELLAVMEAAVKSNPEVKQARQKVADAKTAIINEMCMKDPRFRDALEAYKTTVNRVYIQTRETDGSERAIRPEVETEGRGNVPGVRDESSRSEAHKEGIQGYEETKEG